MASKTNFTVSGKNYFRIRKTIGKNADGKPIQKAFYGKSRRDAERHYEEWKEKSKNSTMHSNASFSQVAKIYAEEILPNAPYASGTITRYYSSYKTHIAKDKKLGNILLTDLTALDIQAFLNRLDTSIGSKNACRKFLSAMLKYCALNGYCDINMNLITLPKEYKEETIVTWSEKELNTIIDNLKTYRAGKYRLRLFIMIATYTGMRFSEILGLKYTDIENGVIKVKRQYYKGEIKKPKANSMRQIPIVPLLQKEIDLHKEWHLKEDLNAQYVFTSENGKMLEYGNVRRSLSRYYDHIGVPQKKIHAYRATFCTLLCRKGTPIQTAASLLGHKSIEVTAKYYTDVNMDDKKNAIAALL